MDIFDCILYNFKKQIYFYMGWGVYMLTEEHIKEGLSRAYVLAVAHRAGFNISKSEFDYGIDGTFKEHSCKEKQ